MAVPGGGRGATTRYPDVMDCPICGARAVLRCPDHPGFREGRVYGIYHCATCDTSYAEPREPDGGVYELVYGNPEKVPGYDRYQRYATAVKGAQDPMDYLAGREDTYWAVREYLATRPSGRSGRFLEVGSGLGYLTYAMARMGLDVRGLDISANAVKKATAMYGEHYICHDLFRLKEVEPDPFDVVVMTEVVEHMPDVLAVLDAVDGILADGGDIVVTTPNRSVYNEDVLWETDIPPLHLWWFSEESMRVVARLLGYSVRFVDFRKYNRTHPMNVYRRRDPSRPIRGPVFRADGALVSGARTSMLYYAAKGCMRAARTAAAIARLVFRGEPGVSSRRGTMCAVFTKGGRV